MSFSGLIRRIGFATICSAIALGTIGCADDPVVIPPSHPTLPPKVVPAFLKDTILERCDLVSIDPLPVSSFAIVSNLKNTGDSTAPTMVREFITREVQRHHMPTEILRSPRISIVRTDALVPPGARVDQWVDVQVSCIEGNNTTSLQHGDLFRTDLTINGGNAANPGGGAIVNYVTAQGPVFINPAYALDNKTDNSAARQGRRTGLVMQGGRINEDRPITLRLRQPQRSLALAIADRIQNFFQDKDVAEAMDEGTVRLIVPRSFNGDWEHFVGLVRHLYLNGSAEFSALKAQQLVDEARKPDALLLDISYAWEGLGMTALPYLAPMMADANPQIAFAAARAGACLGDVTSQQVLARMARTKDHPFQVAAVKLLGSLNASPAVNSMLRDLLNAKESIVRLEAYQMLANRKDSSVISRTIRDSFILDYVPSTGTPTVFATRQGVPRIAILAPRIEVESPLSFLTLQNRLSISADRTDELLTIFYRREVGEPINTKVGPDLTDVIARLGGDGATQKTGINLPYGDVVAIVQAMNESKKLFSKQEGKPPEPVTFVLQDPAFFGDEIDNAPIIPDGSRPQTEAPKSSGNDAKPDSNAQAR